MTNETFNLNQSVQYTLSIRLSTDGFSFSIYNPLNGNNVFFRSYPVNVQHSMAANIKQFLADTDEIKHTFKQINILVHTQRYTSVPLELYEDEQTELLFYQNLPQQKNEVVLCNILGKSNVVILFALDKLSHLFLSEHFPDARFFASISPLTEHFSIKSRAGNNYKLFAHLLSESIDLLAFDKGRAQLINTFPIKGMEDGCYYLLNVWKQLGYDPERDELHLSGVPEKRKDLAAMLHKYLRHIYIINPQAELHVSGEGQADNIPFDMQSLISCE